MVSQKKTKVSENILKLRELTSKISNSEDVDYFDIVQEIKSIISTFNKSINVETNKDRIVNSCKLMVSQIDAAINQK